MRLPAPCLLEELNVFTRGEAGVEIGEIREGVDDHGDHQVEENEGAHHLRPDGEEGHDSVAIASAAFAQCSNVSDSSGGSSAAEVAAATAITVAGQQQQRPSETPSEQKSTWRSFHSTGDNIFTHKLTCSFT